MQILKKLKRVDSSQFQNYTQRKFSWPIINDYAKAFCQIYLKLSSQNLHHKKHYKEK